MITLLQAKQLIAANARNWGNEIIWLNEAAGRVLAEPLVADRDYPPFHRATMDGIAIRYADWENGIRSFRVAETIYAGAAPVSSACEGECYRIMTGAAVPASTDTVIRKEELNGEGEQLQITAAMVTQGQCIAPKGSDTAAGSVLLSPPCRIKTGTLTPLAALGYAEVKVARLPTVAILTTGNEVVPVDQAPEPLQIRNSNVHLLCALLEKWQIKPAAVRHVPDDPVQLQATIRQLMHTDILILSGAVSAGDADYVPQALEAAGVKNIFHKAAIRPGKPVWFGQKNGGPVVFALPGNPFSTYVTFRLLIAHFLCSSWGIPTPEPLYIPFAGSRHNRSGLDEFFPVSLSGNPTQAKPIPFNTSGDITAVMQADGLVWHPADQPLLTEGMNLACYRIEG